MIDLQLSASATELTRVWDDPKNANRAFRLPDGTLCFPSRVVFAPTLCPNTLHQGESLLQTERSSEKTPSLTCVNKIAIRAGAAHSQKQCRPELGLNPRTVGKQIRDRHPGLIATRTFDKEALNELVRAIGSIGVGVVARPFNPFNRQPRTLRPCSVVSLRRSRSILFPANQQRRAFYGVASIRPNGLSNENRPFESLAREDLFEHQRKVVQAPVERERPRPPWEGGSHTKHLARWAK